MGIYSPSFDVFEEHGTVSENRSLQDFTASVVLRCDYNLRHAVAEEMLGLQVPWPNGGFASPPLCQSISITPGTSVIQSVGQSIDYEYALLNVQYGYTVKDLISESLETSAEFQTLDHRFFRWGAGDGDIVSDGEAPGRLIKGLSLVRTLYNVSPPLPTSLLDLYGHCNNAAYTSSLLGLTFPKETLLFAPPNLDRTIRTNGSDGFTITLPFEVNPNGWNTFWRNKTNSYEKIYYVGANSPYESYPLGSFADFLF